LSDEQKVQNNSLLFEIDFALLSLLINLMCPFGIKENKSYRLDLYCTIQLLIDHEIQISHFLRPSELT